MQLTAGSSLNSLRLFSASSPALTELSQVRHCLQTLSYSFNPRCIDCWILTQLSPPLLRLLTGPHGAITGALTAGSSLNSLRLFSASSPALTELSQVQRLLDPHSTLSASSPPPHRPHGAITGAKTAGSSLNSLRLFSASPPLIRLLTGLTELSQVH